MESQHHNADDHTCRMNTLHNCYFKLYYEFILISMDCNIFTASIIVDKSDFSVIYPITKLCINIFKLSLIVFNLMSYHQY